MGGSNSTDTSYQQAAASVSNIFQNTCNFQCNQSINDVHVKVSGSIGSLDFNQTCTINAQCLIYNYLTNDIIQELSQAIKMDTSACSLIPTEGCNSGNASVQSLGTDIQNAVSNQCNIVSNQSIQDVSVDVASTGNIINGIDFSQTSNVGGVCNFQTIVNNSVDQTGQFTFYSATGKVAKFSTMESALVGIVIISAVVMLVILGIKLVFNKNKQTQVTGKTSTSLLSTTKV